MQGPHVKSSKLLSSPMLVKIPCTGPQYSEFQDPKSKSKFQEPKSKSTFQDPKFKPKLQDPKSKFKFQDPKSKPKFQDSKSKPKFQDPKTLGPQLLKTTLARSFFLEHSFGINSIYLGFLP